MILQIVVYLMEMLIALIPAFIGWCYTESTVMAGAVYIIALCLMVRFTLWFVNRPAELPEQYDTFSTDGRMTKVIHPDGSVDVFVHKGCNVSEDEINAFANR